MTESPKDRKQHKRRGGRQQTSSLPLSLQLAAEVEKYPIVWSRRVESDKDSLNDAWKKITEVLNTKGTNQYSTAFYRRKWFLLRGHPPRTSSLRRVMAFLDNERTELLGRGKRERNKPNYNDGLSWAQWRQKYLEDPEKELMLRTFGSATAPKHKKADIPFKLALIAEVKKHSIICKGYSESVDSDVYLDAWKKVAEALKTDEGAPPVPVFYCWKQWHLSIMTFLRYYKGKTEIRGPVVRAMEFMWPKFKIDVYCHMPSRPKPVFEGLPEGPGVGSRDGCDSDSQSRQSIRSSAETDDSCSSHDLPAKETRTVAPGTEAASEVEYDVIDEKYMLRATNQATEPKYKKADTRFKLALIAEVKKHPTVRKAYYTGGVSNEVYVDTWKKIAEALKIDEGTCASPVYYCWKKWILLLRAFVRYYKGETNTRGDVIRALEFMLPSLKINRPDIDWEYRTEPVTEGADENNSSSNSSEVGSVAAEEVTAPTTNQTATPAPQQAPAPGVTPQGAGARSTEQAVTLAAVKLLFERQLTPSVTTNICNTLIETMHQLKPNVKSEILKYGRRQPNLFSIDWSGLSIPAEICREVWRRDAEERLRCPVSKNSAPKKRKLQ